MGSDARRMLRADEIPDELWELIEPVLPAGGHQGRPWNDHRLTLEGISWRFRTGSPWRDLPEHFGAWQSVWERHRRWSDDGTYVRMFAAVRAAAPSATSNCAACCRSIPPSPALISTPPVRGR